jgi:hypothetical protein
MPKIDQETADRLWGELRSRGNTACEAARFAEAAAFHTAKCLVEYVHSGDPSWLEKALDWAEQAATARHK